MLKGKVKWYDDRKGFGFIIGEDGVDVFVHHSTIEGPGPYTLIGGETVEYDREMVTGKGYKATRVIRQAGPRRS